MIYSLDEIGAKEYISLVKKENEGKGRYVHVITFGCQQNERDSEVITGLAVEMGYTPTSNPELADLVIMNTCAIREHAEEKALSMLGKFKAQKKANPDLIVGVVGCMAAEPHRAELLKKDFHYVSFTLEPGMIYKIPEMVARKMLDGRRTFLYGSTVWDICEDMPSVRRESHRAWVSIMYGCNNFCSYCIVPYVRGRERSRRSDDVIDECRQLVAGGVKEITLLGQNVNSYSSDTSFPGLLSAIAEIPGDFIIRFMTSHPKDTSDELISVMARYTPKIAPYFHLPLQSGSTRVLKAMNRTYTKEQFLDIAFKLRSKIPDIALSTDVIIGFPGESDGDFEDTIDVLKKVRFDNVYAFFFSPREGTRAAKMDGEVTREIKERRMSRLLSLQDEITVDRNLPLENTTQRVLVDSFEIREGRKIFSGRTLSGKPVNFEAHKAEIGEYVIVKINKACPYHLLGTAE